MSFARFSAESDVYVFHSVGDFLDCCGCQLGTGGAFYSVADLIAHLREHVAAGHMVPEHLFDPETYGETGL